MRCPGARALHLILSDQGCELTYDTTPRASAPASPACSATPQRRHRFYDLDTTQSSLEDIFVSLVRAP